jgi:uncharacterized protein (TIGR02453 family)
MQDNTMNGFTASSFDILRALEANNNRDWHEAHKADLKSLVRDPFAGMLTITSALLEGSRYPLLGNDKTMFRQNRDVRFSKDKTPYKTNVSGMLTLDGTKTEMGGVVYAQIGPRDGLSAGGFYQLATADLGKVRDRIIADAGRFGDLVGDLAAKGCPLERDNSLKTMPRGFKQHEDHPLAAYLMLKGYTVRQAQPPEVWIGGDIVERLVTLADAIGPLNAWIRDALTYEPR